MATNSDQVLRPITPNLMLCAAGLSLAALSLLSDRYFNLDSTRTAIPVVTALLTSIFAVLAMFVDENVDPDRTTNQAGSLRVTSKTAGFAGSSQVQRATGHG